jgi:plasmid maintenance system antidote protein VapI
MKVTYKDIEPYVKENKNITKNEALKILKNFSSDGRKLSKEDIAKFFSLAILFGVGY